jgi:D-glycero-D-manno-heptose 1,7-bisphosphate phosphatase
MDLIVDSDIYTPCVDNNGTYIDKVPSFNNIKNGYIGYKKYFRWYPGAKKTIKYLKSLNYKVIVVTNQSGIARNYFSYKNVIDLHKSMQSDLKKYGTKIDNFFFCPHHIDGTIKKYKKNCNCRKPKIGLFKKIKRKYRVDKINSFMIGDKFTDMKFAKRIGVKGFFFKKKNLYKFILDLPINVKKN